MDIAKIRKKIKEKKAEEQKPVPVQGEKTEDIQKKADAETHQVQETTSTPQETAQPEVYKESAPADVMPETDTVREKEIEVLAFNVADEEYAVNTAEIHEILRFQSITLVPRSPEYLSGVTSVRGKIIPVIDIKVRLGLKNGVRGKQKIIILKTKKEPVGALVGSILDVIRFSETELLQPPSTLDEEGKNFIKGVVKIKNRFISVLNVDEIVKMAPET